MNRKILCVDDDIHILVGLQQGLGQQFEIDVASGGKIALERMKTEGPYAMVVADMEMPGMNGVEFLREAQLAAPDTVRFMFTGSNIQGTAMHAVNLGRIFQFLTKPCPLDVLVAAFEGGIRQYQLVMAERELLDLTLNGFIMAMTQILGALDPQSFRNSLLLREHIRGLSRFFPNEEAWSWEVAAMLCPIGFVTVPPVILQKARSGLSLEEHEMDMLARVPAVGSQLVAGVPRLEAVAQIILYQEKRFDGSGIPIDSIAGEAIPLGARVIKVLYDLIRTRDGGISRVQALQEMANRTGWYDPQVLKAAAKFFDINFETATFQKPAVQSATLAELAPGYVLQADIKIQDGTVIVTAGTEVTPFLLERLRNYSQLGDIADPILYEESSGDME